MSKQKKKSRRKKFVDYKLNNYRGKTIYFNNYAAQSLFGTDTPTQEHLDFANKVLQKPDYIFSSKPFNLHHYIKRIAKQDYLFEIVHGYGGVKSHGYLRDIKKIKVKKVEGKTLYYDLPKIWRDIRVFYRKK